VERLVLRLLVMLGTPLALALLETFQRDRREAPMVLPATAPERRGRWWRWLRWEQLRWEQVR
jgi:hypothetical protein